MATKPKAEDNAYCMKCRKTTRHTIIIAKEDLYVCQKCGIFAHRNQSLKANNTASSSP